MPANDVSDLKPQLAEINKKDGPLALKLWTDLTAGNMSAITADLSKATSEGFSSQVAVIEQFITSHKFSTVSKTWNPIQDAVDAAKSAVSSLNPLAGLFQANIWIRAGEIALGIILIAVGVAKLTNAVPIASKIARFVP
jgi:hypothetical protein